MKIDLSGMTAIVTGSTGGFAIARGLAECGATVVVNGLTQADVDRAIAGVKASISNAELRGVAADLSTAGAGRNLLRHSRQQCRRL
jgi:NAD(P)-dependent dehydrogenase (short-subunit alcohol dehydrogenase family)